jgi:hypothetical protein
VSHSSCEAAYDGIDALVSTDMLCAAYPGRDACAGDAGGPMFVMTRDARFYQTGVTSWGEGCADPLYPGVYANVRLLSPWIKATGGSGIGLPRSTPSNDNRRTPRTLTGFPTNFAASTVGATIQAGEQLYGSYGSYTQLPFHTIWFAWTAPTTGDFVVHTHGSAFDTVVNVLDSSRGTLLASNDDCQDGPSGYTTTSCATFTGTAGRKYLLQLGGYSDSSVGALKLTVKRA